MTSREQVVSLLERACASPIYDDVPGLWTEVLQLLNLDICYQPAIAKVLKEGRWRGKENPKAYIATASVRQGRAMHLRDLSDREFRRVKSDVVGEGRPTTRQSISADSGRFEDGERIPDIIEGASGGGGVYERSSSGAMRYVDDYGDDDHRQIPLWLQRGDEYDEVDWEAVAVYVVEKPAMARRVAQSLIIRNEGVGRPAAIGMARSKEEAKEIVAAWKWVDRHWESRIVPLFQMENPLRDCEPLFESNFDIYKIADDVWKVEPGFTQLAHRITLRLDIHCQWDGTELAFVRRGLTPSNSGTVPARSIKAPTLEETLKRLALVASAQYAPDFPLYRGEFPNEIFHRWPEPRQKNSPLKMSQNTPWTLTYIE